MMFLRKDKLEDINEIYCADLIENKKHKIKINEIFENEIEYLKYKIPIIKGTILDLKNKVNFLECKLKSLEP